MANAYGNATFNGGDKGWGRLDWAVPSNEEDSIVFVMFDRGKNGFPGLFISCVTHTVTPHEWHIEYGVTPLLMPGGPINMAQQVYFNLDGLRKSPRWDRGICDQSRTSFAHIRNALRHGQPRCFYW